MEMPALDEGMVESRVADGRAAAADNPGCERLGAFQHLLQRPAACETEKDDRGECVTGPDSIDDINAGFRSCMHMFAPCCQDFRALAAMGQDHAIETVFTDEFQCAIGI